MAIVRCNEHPLKHARHTYLTSAEPVGYPDTAVICGRRGCDKAGLVLLNSRELDDYNNGQRIFQIHTNTAQVKVTDRWHYLTLSADMIDQFNKKQARQSK